MIQEFLYIYDICVSKTTVERDVYETIINQRCNAGSPYNSWCLELNELPPPPPPMLSRSSC